MPQRILFSSGFGHGTRQNRVLLADCSFTRGHKGAIQGAPPRIPRCCWLDAVPGVRPFVPFSEGPEMMPFWTYVQPNSCNISFSRLSAVFVCLFVSLFDTFSRLVAFSRRHEAPGPPTAQF